MDLATSKGARAPYARLCVEVDLSKPLLGKYIVEDRVFYVEYESLDNICFTCEIYGHKLDTCPITHPVENVVSEVIVQTYSSHPSKEGDSGSWMAVKRRQKKSGMKVIVDRKQKPAFGSRYSILSNVEGDPIHVTKQPEAAPLGMDSP
ncbi:hypothetical protein LINPERHAP2_LOCUS4762 [Linum perenne]